MFASTVRFWGRSRNTRPHDNPIVFPAAIARGKHPVPSRTRKLSPSAPMVLRGKPRGRAGHRRNTITKGPPRQGRAFRAFHPSRRTGPALARYLRAYVAVAEEGHFGRAA